MPLSPKPQHVRHSLVTASCSWNNLPELCPPHLPHSTSGTGAMVPLALFRFVRLIAHYLDLCDEPVPHARELWAPDSELIEEVLEHMHDHFGDPLIVTDSQFTKPIPYHNAYAPLHPSVSSCTSSNKPSQFTPTSKPPSSSAIGSRSVVMSSQTASTTPSDIQHVSTPTRTTSTSTFKAPPTSSTTSKQPSSPSSSMLTAAAPVVMSSPLSASSMPSDIQHLVAPVRSHPPATPLPLTTRSLSNPGPVRVQKNLVLSSASPPSPSSSSAPASMPRPVVRAVIPLSRNDGRTRNYAQVAATPTPTPTTTTKPHFTIRIITSIAPSPTFNIFPHHTFTVRIITPITPLPAVLPTSVCISSSSSSPSVSPPSSVSSPASPVLVQACALSWFMLSLLLSVGMSSSTSAAVGRNPLSVPVHA